MAASDSPFCLKVDVSPGGTSWVLALPPVSSPVEDSPPIRAKSLNPSFNPPIPSFNSSHFSPPSSSFPPSLLASTSLGESGPGFGTADEELSSHKMRECFN